MKVYGNPQKYKIVNESNCKYLKVNGNTISTWKYSYVTYGKSGGQILRLT